MTALSVGSIRALSPHDEHEVRRILAVDPVESVLVASRLSDWLSGRGGESGRMWGYGTDRLQSLCYSGPNLIPVQAGTAAVEGFAALAIAEGRVCSSIVGESGAVYRLWELLEQSWGVARLVRRAQPMMAIRSACEVPQGHGVRVATRTDLDLLYPAAVAMFTEEIGVSPVGLDGGAAYRARLADLVDDGRCVVCIEDGQVIFKAEIGARSDTVAQIQGVWVHPAYRGAGRGRVGTAVLVNYALDLGYQTVSLYVNDFNTSARAAYEAIGFQTIGTFSTVLF